MSLQEISAAEELMKLAINGQSHVNSLIGYYRDLIDSYNNERADWVLNYNHVNTTAGDQYLLDKEMNSAKNELSDVSQLFALKKAELIASRQKYFKLLENNGFLKKRLQQTKTNYREMMSTCKPVGLNNKQFNNTSLLNSSKMENSKINSQKSGTNISPQATSLQLQLINTNKQHIEVKGKKKEKIDSLKAELNQLLREYEERQEAISNDHDTYLQRLCDLQKKHLILTAEYFRYRTTNSKEQKQLQQENEMIRLKNVALGQKLKVLQKQHSQQFKNIDTQVKKENKKFKQKYDEQLRKKQEHLTLLKQQYERIQDIYLNKIKKLQQQLRTTNEKLKTTDDKSKVEVNSLKSQIRILKSRLEKEGLHEIRKQIARSDEESSQSLEISDLQKINQEVKNLQKQIKS